MDNLMDKIAQKLSAQEVIRANAAADAAQMEKLEAQVAEYDACMKEMRKLNLKNVENEQKLKELLKESSMQIQKLTDECILKIQSTQSEIQNATQSAMQSATQSAMQSAWEKEEEVQGLLEELKTSFSDSMTKIEDLFKESDDFVHKENVKVYRNVQAVMVEELEKQTEEIISNGRDLAGKNKNMFIINIVTLVLAAANLGMLIAQLAGLF